MKKQKILFRLVSYTDAAGKFSPNAFRSGNEDNFYVDDDLTDQTTNKVAQDEVCQLGELGILMVVADGMGGMNAGEVASQIAVDTVKSAFNVESLTNSVIATPQVRQKYLEQVIKQADKNIKLEAKKDQGCEGMGSTIIVAWLFNDELTISWCGDSRAYIFNEKSGIRLISRDHSYVQELVNKGLLTYDQTFDHPQNNIITRSLGDPTKDAQPESKTLKVGKGDIILLCSDGLSGVLRDRKTYDANGQLFPEDNIEDIIRAHTSSMKECREALWIAAERGNWYDNVTAILCQITDGPESLWATYSVEAYASKSHNNKVRRWQFIGVGLFIIMAIFAAFFIGKWSRIQIDERQNENDSITTEKNDSSQSVGHENVMTHDDRTATEPENKPNVHDQIKKQAEGKADTVSLQDSLTKIESREDRRNSKLKGKVGLTPIEYKKDNPVSLGTPNLKKDTVINKPLKQK